jgi:prevent-host-death family protein
VVVNIHEAKTHFSKLVERVRAGEEIVIAKAGTPVAKLVPISESPPPRRLFGGWEGMAIDPDWDSPEANREIEELFYASEIFPEDSD